MTQKELHTVIAKNLIEKMTEQLDDVCDMFITGLDSINYDVPMKLQVACSELATVIRTLKDIREEM